MNGAVEKRIRLLLPSGQPREAALAEVLKLILEEFQSETGTIHRLNLEQKSLHLVAQVGLPPQMLDIVKTIPVGKGIAGQTAAQNKPVTICNLQTDTGGIAKPGAKATGVGGALCVPVHHEGKLAGTLGIGTRREHEYTAEETRELQLIAGIIGDHLCRDASTHCS